MASTFGTGVDFRKLDGNKFTLWKEIMQDVLIIRRHVEAIRHSKKAVSMTIEEWNPYTKLRAPPSECIWPKTSISA